MVIQTVKFTVEQVKIDINTFCQKRSSDIVPAATEPSKEENTEAAKLSIPYLKLATGSFKRQAQMFEMPKRHYSWLCYPVIPV